MTKKEFIDRIEKIPGYYYELEGDKIIIPKYYEGMDWAIESLPPDVEFRNTGINVGVLDKEVKSLARPCKRYIKQIKTK